MKTKFFKTLLIFFTGIFCLFSCQEKKAVNEVAQNDNKADIEVIYFYGKQRCSTCMAIEKFAKEAIDSVFPEKVKDGVIEFKSVDITTADGEKLADLFEISSSSLFIIDNKKENPEKVDMTAFGFRNARNNKEVYKQGVIDQINKFID